MTFGQRQPRPPVPAPAAGSRTHARNVTLLRQLLVLGLGLALLAGLATPLVFMGQGSAQAATQLRSGVYCDGLKAACTQSFATWRGQAVRSTLTFFPDATWADIEGPDWWFKGWQANPYASMAVVTIPMLPAKGTSADPAPSLVTGATGAYNAHWKLVAQRLVATGMGGVSVRLGHELNGSWYRWSAAKNPAAYAAYWRQIVTTMRSVTGAKFTFDWNVAVGTSSWDATLAWPGDAYVDSVGQDVYDQKWGDTTATPAVRWNALVNGAGKFRQGMAFWANFATAHGKPVSFAEWALVAAGASMAAGGEGKDDPYYIQKMHDWFATHPTAFEIYFDRTAGDGDHQLNGGKFPQAAALYRQLFAAPSTTPTPTASATPTKSASPTVSSTPTPTVTASATVSSTPTATPSATESSTPSSTPSDTSSAGTSASVDPTGSPSGDPSASPTDTSSALPSDTPSVQPSVSAPAPSTSPSTPPPAQETRQPASTSVTLRLSQKSNRAGAQNLAGRTVRGSVYVFAAARSGTSVAFYLDDASRKRAPLHVEHTAPFDLVGTYYGSAKPLAVSNLLTGPHTVTAVTTLTDGRKVVTTTRFHVVGKTNPAYAARVLTSASASRGHSHRLSGSTMRGKAFVYLSASRPGAVRSVSFYVDDPHRHHGADRVDATKPFDLVGSRGSRALALDSRLLIRGRHSLVVVIHWRDGTTTSQIVRFRVVR